jgi:chromosome segregation ATPase
MPRVHTVLKNRKPQKCGKCKKEIAIGEGYKHWSFRYGGKSTRCLTCKIARSELTQSGYFAQVYDAQDAFHDALSELERDESFAEAVSDLLDNVYSTADDVASEYQDALDQWEHGNSMLEEKVEGAEQWRDEIESVKDDISGETPDLPDEPDDDADDEEKQEYEEEKERVLSEFCDDIENRAAEAVDGCEFC